MSDYGLIYCVAFDPHTMPAWQNVAQQLNCALHVLHDADVVRQTAPWEPPDIVIASVTTEDATGSEFCYQMRNASGLNHTCFLLLVDDADTGTCAFHDGIDDILSRNATTAEVMTRLRAGLRLSRLRQKSETLRVELQRWRTEQAQHGEYLEDTTTQLVEIAAQLQAEMYRNAAKEEEHILQAQTTTIAQAAAALRHEINNPLFAIMGSAESVSRRLRALRPDNSSDIETALAGIARIQRGAERIEEVVQSISDMLTPATTEYVGGVQMLDLKKKL